MRHYRHFVTFQEQVKEKDSNNDWVITWVTAVVDGLVLENVPAEVLTGSGREFVEGGAVQADIAARIATRWFPGLKSAWRILWDPMTGEPPYIWNIAGEPDMDLTGRREWRIKAAAKVNEGE